MTSDQKFDFTLTILETEADIYVQFPMEYDGDRQVEFWLDTVISKSSYEARIKGALESAYSAALKLYERKKDDYDQLLNFIPTK